MRSIDASWDEDDIFYFDRTNDDQVKHSFDFYLNGIKKKCVYWIKEMRGKAYTHEELLSQSTALGGKIQNGKIEIKLESKFTCYFMNGELHNEQGWARESTFGSQAIKQEWFYKGQKYSYNDNPSVIYPGNTLVWHQLGSEKASREGKPCAIYCVGPDNSKNIGCKMDWNSDDGYETHFIPYNEITDYEPNYFNYIDFEEFSHRVAFETKRLLDEKQTTKY
jgi:hypothetical protein